MRTPGLTDAAADLVLGSACVACGSPGRVLCPRCADALPRRAVRCWPTPAPPGLAPPYAAGPYEGALGAMVTAHKEHRVLALAAPLGRVLGDVVADLLTDLPTGGVPTLVPRPAGRPVLLVPVPSRPAVVRRRGHDPLLRVARVATARLRRRGVRASLVRLLLPVGAVRDQALLGAAERAANLRGSMRARTASGARVVVVDDVLTTGSTAREAQRALEEEGVEVLAIATVAATTRRRPGAIGYHSGEVATTVTAWSPSGSVVASPDGRAGGPSVRPSWPPDG